MVGQIVVRQDAPVECLRRLGRAGRVQCFSIERKGLFERALLRGHAAQLEL